MTFNVAILYWSRPAKGCYTRLKRVLGTALAFLDSLLKIATSIWMHLDHLLGCLLEVRAFTLITIYVVNGFAKIPLIRYEGDVLFQFSKNFIRWSSTKTILWNMCVCVCVGGGGGGGGGGGHNTWWWWWGGGGGTHHELDNIRGRVSDDIHSYFVIIFITDLRSREIFVGAQRHFCYIHVLALKQLSIMIYEGQLKSKYPHMPGMKY